MSDLAIILVKRLGIIYFCCNRYNHHMRGMTHEVQTNEDKFGIIRFLGKILQK